MTRIELYKNNNWQKTYRVMEDVEEVRRRRIKDGFAGITSTFRAVDENGKEYPLYIEFNDYDEMHITDEEPWLF